VDIVVTDVTEMHGDHRCVAGWCAATGTMVRPLPVGTHWTDHLLAVHGVVPGAVISVTPVGRAATGAYPHLNEDTLIDPGSIKLVGSATGAWFGPGAPPVVKTLAEAFENNIDWNDVWKGIRKAPYVPTGVNTRSLSAVQAMSDKLHFLEDFGKLKATLHDGAATYKMAVSCRALREIWRSGGVPAVQKKIPAGTKLHIRVGLARAWEDEPDKCYVMINGIYW
jgi:hypothetical protein